MKTGKILDSVGFRKMDGTTRRLTIREQLIRNRQFVGINEINHPIHGKIDVDRDKIDGLLEKWEEAHLIRLKKSLFSDKYGNL